jgi:hypothetical protein
MSSACSDPLDRLKQTLKVRVPGTTDAMIDLEVVNTIDAFFHRTNAWRWRTAFDYREGELGYDINPPENSALVRVMSMVSGGQPVLPYQSSTDATSGRSGSGRLVEDRHGPDTSIYEPDRVIKNAGTDGTLRYAIFFPQYISISIPSDDTTVRYPIEAELALSINAETCCEDCSLIDLPSWMYQHFHEAWLHGVQSSLMSQISKPYSNPVMAEYHGRKFRMHCGYAKQEADRGLLFDVQRWRYPRAGWP